MKKFLSVILSVMMIVSSMTILVSATGSAASESYASLDFDQFGPYFSVDVEDLVPTAERKYYFYAAAYGDGGQLLDIKGRTFKVGTAGSDIKASVSFGSEDYTEDIAIVKTMFWNENMSPVASAESFAITAGSFNVGTEVNVATNAAAFAYGSATSTTPDMAVDGDAETAWVSLANASYLKDQLVIDLGAAYPITGLNITLADGSDANYTVYGASEVGFKDKNALTELIEVAATGKIQTISALPARYIILEQEATEDAFGVAEILAYTTEAEAADHTAVGAFENVSVGATVHSTTNLIVRGDNERPAGAKTTFANALDTNPSTVHSWTISSNADGALATIELEEAYNLSYITYQMSHQSAITGYGPEHAADFVLVGYNNPSAKATVSYTECDILATVDGSTALYEVEVDAGNDSVTKYVDTGLIVFEVDKTKQNTKYKYYGIYKHFKDANGNLLAPANAGKVLRLNVGTLQAYAKPASSEPEEVVNVALNKAAFSYNSATGLTPADAIDGEDSTYWQSLGKDSLGGLADNFVIDLGAEYELSSIEITPTATASAKNITVYGANAVANTLMPNVAAANSITGTEQTKAYKDWAKTQLATTGSNEITEKLTLDVSGEYRYIVLEQAANETSAMGFAEVSVNSTAIEEDTLSAIGPVSLISRAKTLVAGGTHQNYRFDTTGLVTDDDPSTGTFGYGSKANAGTTGQYLMIDLGEGNTDIVSHVAYQAVTYIAPSVAHNVTTGTAYEARNSCDLQIVASNDGTTFVELGYHGTPHLSSMVGNNNTGLMIIPINADRAYRYIGIRRVVSSQHATTWYTNVHTLQAYTKAN